MQAENAASDLEKAQVLGYTSVEEAIAAAANDSLRAQHVAAAKAYQSSAHALARKTDAASQYGLTPDQINWVEPPFDVPARIAAADVVAAKKAGFRVQIGTTEHRLDLIGRWWWTLSQPGWTSVESSYGNYATEAEAWADAVRALREDPSLGSPTSAAEQPRLWVAMVEHVECPGARLAVFFQRAEPADVEIHARYAGTAKPTELDIAGLFDLSHEASVDLATAQALVAYANAQVEGEPGAISQLVAVDVTQAWLNPAQRAILEKYARGQFAYLDGCNSEEEFRNSIARSGDGILKFLMTEISNAEDCTSGEQAGARIEIAIAQLQSVLDVVQDIPEWTPNDGHDKSIDAGT
ncbi:hypothetical protein DEE69_25170 [Ralstonia insidiosa]|nr:hypothetical protein [Ralstonia insidiosa]MBA9939298.1 hypothetical protein [Ralstonia insidiosa]MBC9968072.1 hypothetical protein [Ralstonia insidiosa]MBX3904365.1 hypothetical protein [Ralstonia insidiosa]